MERIQRIQDVKVRGDMLLCELIEKKEGMIILPDEIKSKNNLDYLVIIAKGKHIDDVEIGDIILDVDANLKGYEINGKKYILIARHLCSIIVGADNFKV